MKKQMCMAVIAALAGTAYADTVTELETPGSNDNGSLATAQGLANSLFTTNTNPLVFGSLPTATVEGLGSGDVDFYCFCVGARGAAYFDIDGAMPGFDSILSLFDSTGTLIGYDDDSSPVDPGSVHPYDAFLGTMILDAGTYYIAVSQYSNFATAAGTGTPTGLLRPDSEFGGVSVAGATPGDSSFDYGPGVGGISPYSLHISIENPCVVPLPAGAWIGLAGLGGVAVFKRRKH